VRFSGRRTIISILLLSTMFAAAAGTAAPASAATAREIRSEATMMRLINYARTHANRQALRYSAALTTIATRQAVAMARRNTIFHTVNLAYALRNVPWTLAGENVGMGPSIDLLHQAFMRSPGHRRNNLEPRFHRFGVGVVWKNGIAFVAVEFTS
jgi:uncharacterized protein YkwD